MLIIDLKVGQYFQIKNGDLRWRVECNDWWPDGRLKKFICINELGHKYMYSHPFDNTTEIKNAVIVDGFASEVKICENCGHIQKRI